MPTCEDIREEFAALLDEELDSETRDTIEAHLSNCSDCLRELHTYKRVADLYRGLPEVAAPEGFERDVLRALQPRNPRLAKLRRAFQGGRGLALAAAVLLVSAVGYFMAQSGFPGMTQKARHMEMASQRRAANTAADVASREGERTREPVDSMEMRTMAEAAPEIAPTEATDTANAANTLTEAARAAQPETFSPQMTNPTPEAAPASRAPEQRTIAGRTFYLTDGVWREEGYTAQTVTQLKRATDTYKSLLSAHMFLNDISSLGSEVILEIDGTWYRMTD